jgi:RNA polymerase sigma-70 factor (sigma-E family)
VRFEAYVEQRLTHLVRFASALCADPGLAEDVVQEVLLRLYKSWDRVENLESPDAYVRRAVVNEYLSWRRKWARVVPHAVVDSAQIAPDHATQQAERSELAVRLAALAPRQRAVLVMRYYGGFSDTEIATALGCRPVTVRAYASRALAALRLDQTIPPNISLGGEHAY